MKHEPHPKVWPFPAYKGEPYKAPPVRHAPRQAPAPPKPAQQAALF